MKADDGAGMISLVPLAMMVLRHSISAIVLSQMELLLQSGGGLRIVTNQRSKHYN